MLAPDVSFFLSRSFLLLPSSCFLSLLHSNLVLFIVTHLFFYCTRALMHTLSLALRDSLLGVSATFQVAFQSLLSASSSLPPVLSHERSHTLLSQSLSRGSSAAIIDVSERLRLHKRGVSGEKTETDMERARLTSGRNRDVVLTCGIGGSDLRG